MNNGVWRSVMHGSAVEVLKHKEVMQGGCQMLEEWQELKHMGQFIKPNGPGEMNQLTSLHSQPDQCTSGQLSKSNIGFKLSRSLLFFL